MGEDWVPECKVCGGKHSTFREMLTCVLDVPPGIADVYTERIADRLAGYSHDEVAEMHPLPEDDLLMEGDE